MHIYIYTHKRTCTTCAHSYLWRPCNTSNLSAPEKVPTKCMDMQLTTPVSTLLAQLVELLCEEMTASFKARDVPSPPWRRLNSLMSKWHLSWANKGLYGGGIWSLWNATGIGWWLPWLLVAYDKQGMTGAPSSSIWACWGKWEQRMAQEEDDGTEGSNFMLWVSPTYQCHYWQTIKRTTCQIARKKDCRKVVMY